MYFIILANLLVLYISSKIPKFQLFRTYLFMGTGSEHFFYNIFV